MFFSAAALFFSATKVVATMKLLQKRIIREAVEIEERPDTFNKWNNSL